jgi:hypothetical protein
MVTGAAGLDPVAALARSWNNIDPFAAGYDGIVYH